MCTHLSSASSTSQLLRSRPILCILGLPVIFLQAKDSYQELLPKGVNNSSNLLSDKIGLLASLPAHTHPPGGLGAEVLGEDAALSVRNTVNSIHSAFVGLLCPTCPFLWLFIRPF